MIGRATRCETASGSEGDSARNGETRLAKGVASRIPDSSHICDASRVARSILIVDDHPSFRATARALLEAEGFEVVGEADTGVAAVRAAHELHPDVVLLDVHLPDFDGFEVAARLRSNGEAPAIVLTSSRDASDFGPLVEQSGARGFVPKGELSGTALATLLG
jgi:DNA-binding NarL/FixJ family response regulator